MIDAEKLSDTVEYPPAEPAAGAESPALPTTSVRVDLAALSHQGKVRPNNEDHYLVARIGRYLQTLMTSLPEGRVPRAFGDTVHAMVVADGMGGMAAGEVASELAITVLVRLVLETPDWIFGLEEPQVSEILDRAVRRFHVVNAALIERARREPRLTGMGTTLTLAWNLGPELFIAHVGDSRVYLLRRGELRSLTRVHTVAQELADFGVIASWEAAKHRLSHVLTHAIGMKESGVEPEVHRVQLADGDRLLLCTDGLTDMVDEAAIAAELRRHESAAGACQGLIDLALERGGKDNVTAIVAGYRIPA